MYMAMMMTAAASEMHNGKRIYSKDSYTDLGDYKKVILKDVSNMRIIEKRTIVKTIVTSNEDL